MTDASSSGVHIASVKLLLGVWVALMIGTWLTVSASNVDLGFLNIWVGLGIATAKALLVGLFYMHLRWAKPVSYTHLTLPTTLNSWGRGGGGAR